LPRAPPCPYTTLFRSARGQRMLHGISDDIGRGSVLLHLVPAPSHLPDEGSVLRLSFGRQIADDLFQIAQSFVHRRGGNRAGLDRSEEHTSELQSRENL